jgi:hypothetical protein
MVRGVIETVTGLNFRELREAWERGETYRPEAEPEPEPLPEVPEEHQGLGGRAGFVVAPEPEPEPEPAPKEVPALSATRSS